jgi:hypothetical protein
MSKEPDNTADVLPPAAGRLLGISWVLLFAGRWVVVSLLLAAGVLTPAMVTDLDDGILVRCYLVLLAVTVAVLVLRAMRSAKARNVASSPQQSDRATATAGVSSTAPDGPDRRSTPGD